MPIADFVAAAMLDAAETAIGANGYFELRTGAPPASHAAADTGTLVATIPCGADWLAAASGRAKNMNAALGPVSAAGSGTIGHFRLKTQAGVVADQGAVTATGGGGQVTVNNPVVVAGQDVTLQTYVLSIP